MPLSVVRRKAEQFLALHGTPLLLLPNAWDALSAKVLEDVGFKAIATTSAGVSWSLGYPDGEKIPWREMLAAIQRIVAAVRVPVTADVEGGFSSATADLIYRTEEIIQAGASGLNIEDGLGHGVPMRSIVDAAERIDAVRRTATRLGVPLVINARTDVYLGAGNDDPALFDEVLTRCRAYFAAGADCVYPLGLVNLEQITKLVAALKRPVNIMGRRGTPSLAQLQAAGVSRVSTATTPVLHVTGALADSMSRLQQTGSFDHFAAPFDYVRLQKLFSPPSG